MKKLFALLIAALMVFSLFACNKTAPAASQPKPADAAEEDPEWPAPGKKITLVVNYAAGAQHDVMARSMAPYFAKYLGCDVEVEVHDGGSGLVGLKWMLDNHPEDGYTWVTWGAPKHDVESVCPSDGVGFYTLDDFLPLGSIQCEYHVLYAAADAPYQNLDEFIAYAKEHPGELIFAGTGTYPGATGYVWETLQDTLGIELQYVPFQGAAETIPAILGGHAHIGSLSAGDISTYVQSGQLIPLCTMRNVRDEINFPDLPSFKEATGIELSNHVGIVNRPIMVSSQVPDYVYEKLCTAFKQVVDDPDFQAQYAKTGYILSYMAPQDVQTMSKATADYALSTAGEKKN